VLSACRPLPCFVPRPMPQWAPEIMLLFQTIFDACPCTLPQDLEAAECQSTTAVFYASPDAPLGTLLSGSVT
jgi:hypothetical protein